MEKQGIGGSDNLNILRTNILNFYKLYLGIGFEEWTRKSFCICSFLNSINLKEQLCSQSRRLHKEGYIYKIQSKESPSKASKLIL